MRDMFPHVVTLYNVVTEEDPSTFEETTVNHITILRGVLLDAVKAIETERLPYSGLLIM